jgi:Transglutaminase-like superfamily
MNRFSGGGHAGGRSAARPRSLECPYPDKPCRVPGASQGRVIGWPNLIEKANWLDGAASLDALRRGITNVAGRFCSMPSGESRTRAIQRWVRDNVRYVHDYRVSQQARGEEFADAESVIERGYGDCDDKARLFVALVRAAEALVPLNTGARIRPVFHRTGGPQTAPRVPPTGIGSWPYEFVHVQAESRWWGSANNPAALPGGWLLTELILAYCEIGQNPDELPRGPNGQRLIA